VTAIVIDGYNLMGVQHGDMEAERRRLVESLILYRKLRGHDITVVFDGWKGGAAQGSEAVSGGVRVIYSPLGEKADRVIKRMVSASAGPLVVVSSDREIQGHAWARGSVAVGAEEFLSKLSEALRGGQGGAPEEDDGEDEGIYAGPRRKGNPRRPSKRDRALRRAMDKL